VHEVVLQVVPVLTLAAVRARLMVDDRASEIRAMFDRVDHALNAIDIHARGRKVILCWGSSASDPIYPAGHGRVRRGMAVPR